MNTKPDNHNADNITVEWINGIKYMSPSPHPNHGIVYSKMFYSFYSYFLGKSSKVFPDKKESIFI